MAALKATRSKKAAAKVLTKTGVVCGIATSLNLKKRDVASAIGALAGLGAKEVKTFGKFALPDLCVIKTMKKPSTKAGVKMIFGKEWNVGAKPARSVARAFCKEKLKKMF